jgi:biopolymer transport protein ExbD
MRQFALTDQDDSNDQQLSLVRLPRPRGVDDEMDITPMIDIVFLLLIFFLVASRMESQASVDLPPAHHGRPVSAKNSVILLVSKAAGGRVDVTTGHGRVTSADDPVAQEAEITEYVEAGLNGLPPFNAAKEHVLIKAERDVKHREVARVGKAVGEAREGQQLHIAVMEVE